MNLPVFLVLSQDGQLTTDLQRAVGQAASFQRVGSPHELFGEMRRQSATGLLLDFRIVLGDGRAEATLIRELSAGGSVARGWVLGPAHCPEPILEACGQSPFKLTSGEVTPLKLAEQMISSVTLVVSGGPFTTIAVEKEHEVLESGSDCWGYSLSGLTRRFETDTPKLRTTLNDLETAARHDVTILLVGESGSGKTYLSLLLHEISPRRNQPFVSVACGAIPPDMVDRELFGQLHGSGRTGATEDSGRFLAAGGGTILLEEIDTLGLEQQVKLLRVIDSGEFEPVGSTTTRRTQARLIVASNVELEPLVEQRKFRPDLYYRLNMLKFEIPPLRKRPRDIVPLTRRFIRQHATRHGIAIRAVDPRLYAVLQQYPWPGNVRELEHVLQRAVIFCRDGQLSTEHLPQHILHCQPLPVLPSAETAMVPTEPAPPSAPVPAEFSKLQAQRELTERELIERALRENSHSRKNTARALGISRVTLYNKMKKYGIIL